MKSKQNISYIKHCILKKKITFVQNTITKTCNMKSIYNFSNNNYK